MKFITQRVSAVLLLTSLQGLFLVFFASSFAADDQDISHIRLDAHPTPENSVLFTFDDGGPTMRLPKILFPLSAIPRDVNQTIKAMAVNPIFWYPDMTPSDWTSVSNKIFEHSRNVSVPEPDRFRVRVIWMYYFSPEWDNFVPGKTEWQKHLNFDPLPKRIEINNSCPFSKKADCLESMTVHLRSAVNGLDTLADRKWAETHHEEIKKSLKNIDFSNEYVSRVDAPYDLLMRCNSLECTAYGYSKTYHIAWRLLFPSEAIRHTDELMRSIDRMLASWSEK